MRLRDIGRSDQPLPAEIEAELDALDAALSGAPVPRGMEGLETLVDDMRAERAAPDDEFGAALDHWAAAGFPRGRQPRLSEKATASDAGGRFRLFLASLTPRRLAYAGGAAATLVVLVVARLADRLREPGRSRWERRRLRRRRHCDAGAASSLPGRGCQRGCRSGDQGH